MLFTQSIFLVFLPVVLVLYFSLRHRAQNAMLLAASYVFYGWWDWRFLSLIWLSTVVDYTVARAMDGASGAPRRRLLGISVVSNLTILGFFKYFDFFADSASRVLHLFGFQADLPTLSVVLPVGISFYTFQTMSYTIDVYRGDFRPERSFLNFALFVAFFPQLVAGPIERADHLLTQLETERRVTWRDFVEGGRLMLLGYFLKVAIADTVAPEVDRIFGGHREQGCGVLLSGAYLFSIQIYGDFAGYSKIARGTARLLGVDIRANFAQPFLSPTITELWRRWHMSLYAWFRDYVYIPLGGNRRSPLRRKFNVLATMTLSGLWHGAGWNFVFWGWLNGLFITIHGRLPPRGNKPRGVLNAVFCSFATFNLFAAAMVFFRSDSFLDGFVYMRRMFSLAGSPALHSFVLPAAAVLVLFDLAEQSGWNSFLDRLPWGLRGALYASMIYAYVLASGEYVPFIYFRF